MFQINHTYVGYGWHSVSAIGILLLTGPVTCDTDSNSSSSLSPGDGWYPDIPEKWIKSSLLCSIIKISFIL